MIELIDLYILLGFIECFLGERLGVRGYKVVYSMVFYFSGKDYGYEYNLRVCGNYLRVRIDKVC